MEPVTSELIALEELLQHITQLEKHGRWESTNVTENYVDKYLINKNFTTKEWVCEIDKLLTLKQQYMTLRS